MLSPRCTAALLAILLSSPPLLAADAPAAGEKAALLDALAKSKYKFTPTVRAAYLKYAKAKTLAALAAAGKEPPKEFLAWVDKDPIVEATVYGARPDGSRVLMALCALWLDVGPKDAAKYKQLLLAAAVAAEADGAHADLSPRQPVPLDLPEEPAAPLAARAPAMTPSQAVRFLIRNDTCKFDGSEEKAFLDKKLQARKDLVAKERQEEIERRKEELKRKGKPGAAKAPPAKPPALAPKAPIFTGKRKWPLFDLAGTPWPLLTPLIMNRLPLGEAQAIWKEFVQTGTVEFSEAVTTDPALYGPGSWQATRRDEGASPTARTQMLLGRDLVMGIPSMMGKHYEYAQPCHFSYGENRGEFALIPHSQMGPYMPQEAEGWPFGPSPARGLRLEFWQASMAYAMNRGIREYLDSCMVLDAFLLLPASLRKAHGADLLGSGLATNPYNADLATAFGATIASAEDVVDACNAFDNALLAAQGSGRPRASAYSHALRGQWIARLSSLPVPDKKETARKVMEFLKRIRHPDASLRFRYQAVAEGAASVRDKVAILVDAHLADPRTPASCRALAAEIKTAAASADNPEKRAQWIKDLRKEFVGKEDYFLPVQVDNPYLGGKDAKAKVAVQTMVLDEAVATLAELDKNAPLPPKASRREKMLDQVSALLKKHLASTRDPAACQAMATQITTTCAQIEDATKRATWLKSLAALMQGKAAYLVLVQVKDSHLSFPQAIKNDETDRAIQTALPGVGAPDPEAKRWEKPLAQAVLFYRRHVTSRRTAGSCLQVAALIQGLAGSIRDDKQKKDWLKDLYRAAAGRENYAMVPNGPLYRDPSADTIAKLLGLGAKPMPRR